eukprot:317309-Rhodomonas_salina.4
MGYAATMSSTETGYAATMSGTETGYAATRFFSILPAMLAQLLSVQTPICLRARYAMSGTAIPYGTISLRARYALSGTAIAYCVLYARDVRD